MRRILCLILTLSILLCLSACGGTSNSSSLGEAAEALSAAVSQAVSDSQRAEAGVLHRDNAAADGAHGDTNWADMTYYHYSADEFYAMVDELTKAADDGDEKAVIALYDELYTEYTVIDTLGTIAYVRYCGNVTDTYWSDEQIYCYTLLSEAGEALCAACREILSGPCAKAFREHVGEDAAAYFADYTSMSAREISLTEREAELINQYYEIMDGKYSIACTIDGEEWTLDRFLGIAGMRLYDRDVDAYVDTYYAILKAINDQVGPIYVELVQLRNEIAQLNGYDNYNDYAYEVIYARDYSPADAQALCDIVKGDVSHAYYGDDIFYSDLFWYGYTGEGIDLTTQTLLSILETYTPRIDQSLYETYQYMTEYGLYDFGNGSGRMQSCYATSFSLYNAPFIYLYTYDSSSDVSDIVHEFGHYADAYKNLPENILCDVGSYDLFEIHSTGLEVLFMSFYDDIFGTDADAALFIALANQMYAVIDGCIYDEFQRRVYENPDMTLDDINALYCSLCEEYGAYYEDYGWMDVPHNYESPLYYISYAVSTLASLQIWDQAQTDFDAAAQTWLAILEHGAYKEGYAEVLNDCGLLIFTQDGAVEEICEPVLAKFAALGASGQ